MKTSFERKKKKVEERQKKAIERGKETDTDRQGD